MSIFVLGINHKTAPITLREKVYFALDKVPLYLQDLLSSGYAHEAVLLSTCNRSELYCDAPDVSAVRDWFFAQTTAPRADLDAAMYIYRDEEAVAHIMQVASGLDSMVLGEPQILGQVKEAFSESCTAGAIGTLFHRLFQQVFAIAKDIRTTTAIGACPVSVVSAAVQFMKSNIPSLTNANIVLLGAGDTSQLLMRYLAPQMNRPIRIVSRSLDKVTPLIDQFGGYAHAMTDLIDVLAQADAVFSATSSPTAIVDVSVMKEAMRQRRDRPMWLLDIAVPRDIEPSIANVPNVHLYCIDDLKTIIEKNRKGREHAADKAFEMIHARSEVFLAEWHSMDKVTHTIRAYRGQIEALCRVELFKAKEKLYQGDDPAKVMEAFAQAFIQKLMHAPSVQLRQAGAEGRFELLRFAKQLFSLPDPETERL